MDRPPENPGRFTEHVASGAECPHGDRCTFAHNDDELGTEVVEIRFDVPKHMFAGYLFKADAATGREMRKTRLEFANDIEAVLAEECFEFAIDTIAFVELPNEIQNSEAFLAWVQAQASPELLEKNRQAIRGPEE
jgi:hypothetical protein